MKALLRTTVYWTCTLLATATISLGMTGCSDPCEPDPCGKGLECRRGLCVPVKKGGGSDASDTSPSDTPSGDTDDGGDTSSVRDTGDTDPPSDTAGPEDGGDTAPSMDTAPVDTQGSDTSGDAGADTSDAGDTSNDADAADGSSS